MDGAAQQPSPLLLQMSNTASNEARRHWLLEKRLTAPLPDGGAGHDGGAGPDSDAAGRADAGADLDDAHEARAGGVFTAPQRVRALTALALQVADFGIVTHRLTKRPRLDGAPDGESAPGAAHGWLDQSALLNARLGARVVASGQARQTSKGEAAAKVCTLVGVFAPGRWRRPTPPLRMLNFDRTPHRTSSAALVLHANLRQASSARRSSSAARGRRTCWRRRVSVHAVVRRFADAACAQSLKVQISALQGACCCMLPLSACWLSTSFALPQTRCPLRPTRRAPAAQLSPTRSCLTPVSAQAKTSAAQCVQLEQEADELRHTQEETAKQCKAAIIQVRRRLRACADRALAAGLLTPTHAAGQNLRRARALGAPAAHCPGRLASRQRGAAARGRVAARGVGRLSCV